MGSLVIFWAYECWDPDPKRVLIIQMSNEQKPGCLGCIGDEFLKREEFFLLRFVG